MPGIEPMPPPIQEQRTISHQCCEAVLHALPLALVDVGLLEAARDRAAGNQQVAQFRQREDAQQQRRQRQPVPEIEAVERPAQRSRLRIGADHRDHDAEAAGRQSAQRRVAGQQRRPSICLRPRTPAAPANPGTASPGAGSGSRWRAGTRRRCRPSSTTCSRRSALDRLRPSSPSGIRRGRSPPRRHLRARRTAPRELDRRLRWSSRDRAAARRPRTGPC